MNKSGNQYISFLLRGGGGEWELSSDTTASMLAAACLTFHGRRGQSPVPPKNQQPPSKRNVYTPIRILILAYYYLSKKKHKANILPINIMLYNIFAVVLNHTFIAYLYSFGYLFFSLYNKIFFP